MEIDAGAAAFFSSSFEKIGALPDTSARWKMSCGSGTFVRFGVKMLDGLNEPEGVNVFVARWVDWINDRVNSKDSEKADEIVNSCENGMVWLNLKITENSEDSEKVDESVNFEDGLGLLLGWNRLTKLDDFENREDGEKLDDFENFDEGENSVDFVKWFDGEKPEEGEKQDDCVNWEESVK